MASLNLVWAKYWLFDEIQTNYRPFSALFLKKSVLQTKIIYTDWIVITAIAIQWLLKLQLISFIFAFSSQPTTNRQKYFSTTMIAVEVDFDSQLILNMNWGWFATVLGHVIRFIANISSN